MGELLLDARLMGQSQNPLFPKYYITRYRAAINYAKISFFGDSTFTLGAQVAITLAPDRPNELKCFNIAFGGGDCRIQITLGGVKSHPGRDVKVFTHEKLPLTRHGTS